MPLADSEFILNADGSIYHLNLKPENIAKTIILVGDPDRVDKITKYFEAITFETQRREFRTKTGVYKDKEITVISTGIGTDNIDIVLNELDALVNIDFATKEIKTNHTPLDIIRIGTSGGIQKEIPIDSFVISEFGIGLDSVLHFYQNEQVLISDMASSLVNHIDLNKNLSTPYIVSFDHELGKHLHSSKTIKGMTITNVGFYGPQGRVLRLPTINPYLNQKIASFSYEGKKITNFEMETSAIYGLSQLLGHRAISMNAIIANRATGEFSKNPGLTVDKIIKYTLNKVAHI